MPATVGYSGTPLAKKLGFKALTHAFVSNPPEDYESLLEPLPEGVVFEPTVGSTTDLAHIFVTRREDLAKELSAMRRKLSPAAALWVSWPKKASKVPTTVTEDVIREEALSRGFVDIKVCAVSEVWSGLKLVVRKGLR